MKLATVIMASVLAALAIASPAPDNGNAPNPVDTLCQQGQGTELDRVSMLKYRSSGPKMAGPVIRCHKDDQVWYAAMTPAKEPFIKDSFDEVATTACAVRPETDVFGADPRAQCVERLKEQAKEKGWDK